MSGDACPFTVRERHVVPFRYFLADGFLGATMEKTMLAWFETAAPWKLVETDFYEQYEFSMFNASLPDVVDALVSAESLNRIRRAFERLFQEKLLARVDVVAHKLVQGQRIAVHNDHLEGGETHRFTVQINDGLTDENGGFFMLFNSSDASDIHRILRPVSGTAIGFAIGPDSHHAVSRLHGGVRYTLVYSFHSFPHDVAG